MGLIETLDEQGGAAICSKQFRRLEEARIDVFRRLLDHQIEVVHRHGAAIGAVEQAADFILNAIENHDAQTLRRPILAEKRLKLGQVGFAYRALQRLENRVLRDVPLLG